MKGSLFGGLAAFALAVTEVSAITPITIKGNAFYKGNERVSFYKFENLKTLEIAMICLIDQKCPLSHIKNLDADYLF